MKIWCGCVVLVALGGVSYAETFDGLVDQSTTMSAVNISADYWPGLVDCKRGGDEFHRAQCHTVRRARAKSVASRRYLVEAKDAIFAGPYSVKNRSVRLAAVGCLDCSRGFDVSGKNYLFTSGPVRKLGTRLIGPILGRTNVELDDPQAAAAWRKEVLPRLVAELIVDSKPAAKPWRSGRRRGVKAKVVGFRIFDPCDGRVLVAKPVSKKGPVDKGKC